MATIAKRYGTGWFMLGLLIYLLLFLTAPQPGFVDASQSEPVELTRLEFASWVWFVQMPKMPAQWLGGDVDHFGIGGRIYVATLAAAVMLLASMLGNVLLLTLPGLSQLTRFEWWLFSCVVGLNALSLFTLAVGLAGWLQSIWPYVGLLVVLFPMTFLVLRRTPDQKTKPAKPTSADPLSRSSYFRVDYRYGVAVVVALFAGVLVLGAMNPPREFDVREYHLQTPKEWYQAGEIGFVPHNVYSNMPMGPQVLSLPAMALASAITSDGLGWWWGALAGKTLIAVYAVLTALVLIAAGKRLIAEVGGYVAALIWLSIPWIAHVSMEGLVDGVLAANLFFGVYAVLIWGQTVHSSANDTSRSQSVNWSLFALSGFLIGAAVATKYTALMFGVLPLFVLFRRSHWRLASVFLLAVVVGGGLWLAKNWALAGNPVYPLAYGVFGGETRTPSKANQWEQAHAVPRDDAGNRYSPPQLINAISRWAYRSAWLSPVVLPLALLSIFVPQHRRLVIRLWAMALFLLATWWLLTHRIDRFWLPVFPLLALLAGIGVMWKSTSAWQRVAIGVMFWGLLWNLLVITSGAVADHRLLADLDFLREDPQRVHPAHRFLNEMVPSDKTALLVGDAQPFDLQVPALYNTCFDDCLLERFTANKSPAAQWQTLRDENISHVFVQWSEIDRYRSPGNYGFTDYVTKERMNELVRHRVLNKPWGKVNPATGQPDTWVGEVYPIPERFDGNLNGEQEGLPR